MVISDHEDSLTKLNTALNKSMVLMDGNTMDKETKVKSRKSITINTSTQGANTPAKRKDRQQKSILKKSDPIKSIRELISDNGAQQNNDNLAMVKSATPKKPIILKMTPHNLEEIIEMDTALSIDPTASSFTLEDVDDDDELWLVDLPKTLNPHELAEQTLFFNDKTKIKIGDDRYTAVSETIDDNDINISFTSVFSTGKPEKPYKTVNIKPTGRLVIKKKLSNSCKRIATDEVDYCAVVPFPENLKIRHPYFIERSIIKDNGSHKARVKRRRNSSE